MNSSQNVRKDLLLSVYQDKRSVFRLTDVAQMTGETSFNSLNKRLNYFVRTGKIMNPRRGIYTKPVYNPEELACTIYAPSYISLDYVLQKSGIIFQYDSRITAISYLSRSIEIEGRILIYRKIKGEILVNTAGINRLESHVNIASPERAFLDMLYLDPYYYFDNLKPLDITIVRDLLTIYQSAALSKRFNKLIKND
jgi:hypothetical protein